MNDEEKTREQLLDELVEMRNRIAEFEKQKEHSKRLEDALQKSRDEYQSLFDNMLNGFAYCEMIFEQERPKDFIYLRVNRAFEILTGLKNVIGNKASETIGDLQKSDPNLLEIYGKVAVTGVSERFEIYIKALQMWFSVSVFSPQKKYFVAIFDVITERKKTEELLRESEQRLALAASSGRIGMFEWHIDSGGTFWNDQHARLLGIAATTTTVFTPYQYGDWAKCVHPEDLPRIEIELNRCMSECVSYDAEYRVVWPDESIHWLSARGDFLYDEQNKAKLMRGIVMDITERKLYDAEIRKLNADLEQKVEERTIELQTSEKKYRKVFENELIAISIFDLETLRFIDCNSTQVKLYGYSREELLGDMVAIDLSAESGASLKSINEIKSTGSTVVSLRYHKKKDGTVFPVEIYAGAYSMNGRGVMVGMVKDITKRIQVESALKESEEKYRSMVETISDCIWETDASARFTYLSPNFQDITGYPSEEFLGKTPFDFAPEDNLPQVVKLVSGTLDNQKPFSSIEFPVCHREGKKVIVELNAVPILDSHGSFKGFRGVTRDITSRKNVEVAIKLNLAIMETVAEGIFLIGVDDNIIKWTNRKFEAMFGYDLGEMTGMHVDIVNAPTEKTSAETRISIVELLLQTGEWHGEIENIRKDGTHFWCFAHVSLFDHPHFGKVMVSAHTDITGRKQLEQKILRSERDLRAILNNIPSLVGYWDKDLHNRFGNHLYWDWFGIDPDKMSGMNLKDILGEKSFSMVQPHIEGVLAGQPQTFEPPFTLLNGSTVRHLLTHFIPDISNGQVEGFFNLVTDITPLKFAEKQRNLLAKADSLNRMAGAIAHHFNNQLSAVIGNLELLMEDMPLGSDNYIMLTDAMMASHKAAELSKLMLTYLGQSSGKMDMQDFSEICQKGLLMLQALIPRKVSMKTQIPFPGPAVSCDTNRILQVVTHLMTNAWESLEDQPGTIALSVSTVSATEIPVLNRFPVNWTPNENSYVCLEVTDTGCGIPNWNMEKIFDPFFTTKFTGRGLGLSVVMGIIKMHGGGISVENRVEGGCAFRVYLPQVSKTAPAAVDKIVKKPEAQEGRVVLLIDDQDQVRKMAGMMLSRQGYSVLEAGDGVEAVEIFQQYRDKICLVITDLTMPRMNGWETLAALRKISPDIPVILSSGYDEAHVMTEGKQDEHPNAFLGKPYQKKDLYETISRILAETR